MSTETMTRRLHVVGDDDLAPPVAPSQAPSRPRVGLVELDVLGLRAMAGDKAASLMAETQASADSLVGEGRDAARQRLVARLLAVARSEVCLLQAMYKERLLEGNERGLRQVEQALATADKRLTLFLEEHRRESSAERRPVVTVGGAEQAFVKSR